MRLIFSPKIKSIRPMVSEKFGNKQTYRHTDRHTSCQYYKIDSEWCQAFLKIEGGMDLQSTQSDLGLGGFLSGRPVIVVSWITPIACSNLVLCES